MQLPTRSAPVAQWQPGPHGPGPHGPGGGGPMGSGGTGMADAGWSLGMGLGGGWWLLLVAVLLLVGVVAAVAYLSRHAGDDGDAALAVLRERYAAGDLDGEKFRRRRERLRGETD